MASSPKAATVAALGLTPVSAQLSNSATEAPISDGEKLQCPSPFVDACRSKSLAPAAATVSAYADSCPQGTKMRHFVWRVSTGSRSRHRRPLLGLVF